MQLKIENLPITARPGQTLLSLITKLGLDDKSIKNRPLAAQIGGEVFHLNYAPIRENGVNEARSAIQNAGGDISLLRIGDALGRHVYERTILFVLLSAARKLFKDARIIVQYSLGPGLFMKIDKEPALSTSDAALLREECLRIVAADIPLKRQRLNIDEAVARYEDIEQHDKIRLLKWRKFSYFDSYTIGDYTDYLYGEMAPSTGYVRVFDLHYMYPGMILLLPDNSDPEKPAAYRHSPKLATVFSQSDTWGRLLHCSNAADLNDMVVSGHVRELVRISEALHEKSYAELADKIVQRNARAVLLAGPSSSGKTSSANRLYTQLRVLGKTPIMLSLDDYYIDRHLVPYDEDGEQDLEHVETIDIPRFRYDLERLVAGGEVSLPEFDFQTGRRKPVERKVRAGVSQPLIIEGIHGLNPLLLSPSIQKESVFRVYVSALTTLNLDDHNRIRTTSIRLLRRMVRDFEMRNASPEKTLSMWASVRRGEEKWIFPFQEEADAFFNTALAYEIAVLKKHIFPLLIKVAPQSPHYTFARDIIKFLNYFADAHIEDEIPPTSILREFIGGSAFFG